MHSQPGGESGTGAVHVVVSSAACGDIHAAAGSLLRPPFICCTYALSSFICRSPPPSYAWPPRCGMQVNSKKHSASALSIETLHAACTTRPSVQPLWAWALTAGAFPEEEDIRRNTFSAVLVTGHSDGCVTFWDVACEVPRQLCRAEPGLRKAVSVVAVDADAGLMAVGYRDGQVWHPSLL